MRPKMKLKSSLNHWPSRQTWRGFTLIEILVVIAIIALLAAILFPVFSRMRENARRSTCASNLKQIGLGMLQYAQDYDERLPNTLSLGYGWAPRIYPYINSVQILRCPNDTQKGYGPDAGFNKVSYGINPFLFQWKSAIDSAPGLPISRFNSPASTVMMTEVWGTDFPKVNETKLIVDEESGGATNTYQASMAVYPQSSRPSNNLGDIAIKFTSPYPREAHDDTLHGLNYLAADGHVKFLPSDKISFGDYGSGKVKVSYFYIGSGYTGGSPIEPNKTSNMGDAALTFNYQ